MNSVNRRSFSDIGWDIIGYLIIFVAAMVAGIIWVCKLITNNKETVREYAKAFFGAVAILAFTPGFFYLCFYLMADVQKITGVARGMCWWWIWMT